MQEDLTPQLVRYLAKKVECLRAVLRLTEGQLQELEKNDFSKVDLFSHERENQFKAFGIFHQKLSQGMKELSQTIEYPLPQSIYQSQAKELELELSNLAQTIISLDRKILELMDAEKNRLSTELSHSEKNQKLVNKFKSQWVTESGIRLDGKL